MPNQIDEFKKYLCLEAKKRNVKIKFKKNLKTFGETNLNDLKNKCIFLKDLKDDRYIDIYKYTFFHELAHLKYSRISSIINKTYINKITEDYCFKDGNNFYIDLTKKDMKIVFMLFNCIEDAMVDSRLIGKNKSMSYLYEQFLKFNFREKLSVFHKNDYVSHIGFMIKLFLTSKRYFEIFIKNFGMKKSYLKKMKFNEFLNLVKINDIKKSNSLNNFKMAIKIFKKAKEYGFGARFQNKSEFVLF